MLDVDYVFRIYAVTIVISLITAILISYRLWRFHRDFWNSLGGKSYFDPLGGWNWRLRSRLFVFTILSREHLGLNDTLLSNAVYFGRVLMVFAFALLFILLIHYHFGV
jgi:hypothetical protein